MALVQVESDALDALDAALDEVATALEAKIESLKTSLPDADLSALDADVAALRALAAPAAEPPVEWSGIASTVIERGRGDMVVFGLPIRAAGRAG